MAIRRALYTSLEGWKNRADRKPLIVRGARQVGKTTLVDDFGSEYGQYLKVNLERADDLAVFEGHDSVSDVVDALFLGRGLSVERINETLLFIDEIQESTKAIAMLRYFYEDIPGLHVIAAGSLLEHVMGDVGQFPVGRVQFIYLFPFSFKEFLLALGKENVLQRLNQIPIDEVAHSVAMDLFHQYAIVGGMPEVVMGFMESGMLSSLPVIYESIWSTYKEDVSKYATNTTQERVIRHIVDTAPFYLDQRITFENFGKSNYRSREVGESFRSLDDAGVIRLIYPTTAIEPPIIPDLRKKPRMQFLDTGIVNHALGIQADLLAMEDMSDAYKGALIPHLATQEIIALNSESFRKPNFWVREKKSSQAEVDLVYPYHGKLIPIEIKSGPTGTLRSLHQFVERSEHPYAVRIYGGTFNIQKSKTPGGTEYTLMNLPYYLVGWLEEYLDYLIQG